MSSPTIEFIEAVESGPPSEPEAPLRASRWATWKWFGRKLGGTLATLIFISVVNFFLFRVINPHPENVIGRGRATTPEAKAEIRHSLGLDQPLYRQFFVYLKDLVTLQFGQSTQYNVPVRDLILSHLWPTIALVGTSAVLSIIIGLSMGTVAAWNRGHKFDKISTSSSVTLYSMPEWWLGLILFAIFSTGLWGMPRIFPVGRLIDEGLDPTSLDGLLNEAWHLILPVTTLTLAYLADYMLIMRSALLDEVSEDYLQTARAKGLRDVMVRRRHAVRNALLPVVTIVTLDLGFVVGGAVTIETVFSIPGLGLLTTDALEIPDIPVLQGTFFIFSAAVVFANLVSNLLYGYLDPRVRI